MSEHRGQLVVQQDHPLPGAILQAIASRCCLRLMIRRTQRVGSPKLLRKWDTFPLRERLDEPQGLCNENKGIRSALIFSTSSRAGKLAQQGVASPTRFRQDCCCTHILAANGLNDVLWRCTQKFSDDGELVDILASRADQPLAKEVKTGGTNGPCPGKADGLRASRQKCILRSRYPLHD